MMEKFNIKCNNEKEANFVIKYIFDNKHVRWSMLMDIQIIDNRSNLDYPIIIHNYKLNEHSINWFHYSRFYKYDYIITEAKHLMRDEKLKRINNE